MSNTPVSPKVWSGSLTAAGTVVVLYLLAQIPFLADAPEGVLLAGATLILAGTTWVGTWIKTDPLRRAAGEHRKS